MDGSLGSTGSTGPGTYGVIGEPVLLANLTLLTVILPPSWATILPCNESGKTNKFLPAPFSSVVTS